MNIPEPSQADIDELLTLYGQDNYSTTEIRADELIARFPDHGFGWKLLGVALRQQGPITASLVPMQKAARQHLLASRLVDTISFARYFEAALWRIYQS